MITKPIKICAFCKYFVDNDNIILTPACKKTYKLEMKCSKCRYRSIIILSDHLCKKFKAKSLTHLRADNKEKTVF